MPHAFEQRAPSRGRFFFLILTVIAALSIAQAAFANPVDDKQKKAASIASQIDANGDKISALSESYDATRLQLSSLSTAVADAQAQLVAAQAQNTAIKSRVQMRAVNMYTSTDISPAPGVDPSAQRKDQYANIATGNDSSTLLQLQITTEAVNERKDALNKEMASISQQEKYLADQQKSLESANAAQVALLKQTKGELAALIADQQAKSRAAAQKAAKAKTGKSSNQSLPANLPAPSPKAAVAIEFARQQLGKPYRYAATGPGSFDCSGLTMRAYGAAGLSLPHYSGAQYSMFPHVPTSALQPGDLVFRGAGGSAHVGLYIGNGLMIHAPHTGDVVKIAAIGSIIGGARPG